MDYLMFILSNEKEESLSIQSVNVQACWFSDTDLIARKPVFWVCNQVRLKPARLATETS